MAQDARKAIQAMTRRLGEMEAAREEFRPHWKEIGELNAPQRGRGLSGSNSEEDTDGSKKGAQIYDPTGVISAGTTAAGMQSGITSQSRPWFRLALQDRAASDSLAVRMWLSEVERRLRAVFEGSNFYKACYHTYSELAVFGTGAFSIMESFENVIHCKPFTIGEYYLANGPTDRVNTFVRRFWPTALQIVEEFGEKNVSQTVKNAAKGNATEARFEVIHFVEPNDDRIELRDIRNRPTRSVYYEAGNNNGKVLRVRGFDEMPVMATRWDVVGSGVYGIGCPGMNSLPDVKGLQKMRKKYYTAIDKLVDPPLQGSADMRYEEVNDIPGGLSFINQAVNQWSGYRPLHQVPVDTLRINEAIQQDRQTVREHFFADLFRMISSLPMRSGTTATEIAERHEEKLMILGPVLERVHDEMLSPGIDRTYSIMLRSGLIPEPPPEIQGQPIKIEYIGILAQAQKLVGLGAIEGFMGFAGNLASVNPQVLDKIDMDEAIELYGDAIGVPPSVLVPQEQVNQIRAARAAQAQAQQQGQAAMAAADGAKTLSETDTGGNNMLTQMLGIPA